MYLARRSLAHVFLGLVAALGVHSHLASANEPMAAQIDWQSDVEQAWANSQTQKQPLLLFVKTDGCVFCTKMERETYSNESVARQVSGTFVASSVNGRSIPDLVRKLNIRIYPTTVIIGPDAQVLDSIPGFVPAATLQSRLEIAAQKSSTVSR